MQELIVIFIFTIAVLVLMLVGLGVKMLVKKNGEFKKQCSVVDPLSGTRVGCTCGKSVLDDCESDQKHQPLHINKRMLDEL